MKSPLTIPASSAGDPPRVETTEEAYSAIEDMLRPLEDPYTRILRPKDYELLKSSNLSGVIP